MKGMAAFCQLARILANVSVMHLRATLLVLPQREPHKAGVAGDGLPAVGH